MPLMLVALASTLLLGGCQLLLEPDSIAPPPPPPDAGPNACVPRSCEEQGKFCGGADDGCGALLDCPGRCAAPETCGGGGVPNQCGRREICTRTGWCWENPLPQGEDLTSVFGFSATDVWAVGASGTALHWDGVAWERVETGTSVNLRGAWGSSRDDLWFGCDRGMLHWDGEGFELWEMPSAMHAVWGSSSADAWAAGNSGALVRWDGTEWIDAGLPAGSGNVRSLSGTSSRDVWGVGAAGLIVHWDGKGWARHHTAATAYLHSVWAHSPTEAWAVGASGTILRWDGLEWAQQAAGTQADLYAVFGFTRDEVWALGEGAVLLRFDGSVWRLEAGAPLRDLSVGALWGFGPSDVWAVGSSGTMLRFDGTAWGSFSKGPPCGLRAVWGTSRDALWAVGSPAGPAILRRQPSKGWELVPSNARAGLLSIHGSSDANVWAVGEAGEAVRLDGVAWRRYPDSRGLDLNSVWTASDDAAFAVGEQGLIVSWTGTTWKQEPSATTEQLLGVWGSSPGDVWAVGTRGTAIRRGQPWAPIGAPLEASCAAVSLWWASGDDRWIGASKEPCSFLHLGSSWTPFPLPSGSGAPLAPLRPWGTSRTDLWAPRGYSPPLSFNGSAWAEVDTGSQRSAYGVWTDETAVWLVGSEGTILRRDK